MNENSKIIDLNRKRAGVSYINLVEFLNNPDITEESKKKMKSYCRKLPILIKTNGLLATLSFIKGKSKENKDNEEKNEYAYIYLWLESWLDELEGDKPNHLIDKLINSTNNQYNKYIKEAIQISIWYKRHAEAMI